MEVIEAEPQAIKDRVLEVLELVGLKGEIRRFPNELSAGNNNGSRLHAIVNRPDVDCHEPTGI